MPKMCKFEVMGLDQAFAALIITSQKCSAICSVN